MKLNPLVRKSIYLIVLLSISNLSLAQIDTNYPFSKIHDYQLPDSLSNEDAILLNKITDIAPNKYAKIYQKIYINSEEALNQYASVSQSYPKSKMDLTKFDAQIIKPDGEIISFGQEDIYEEKSIYLYDRNKKRYITTLKIPFPELEIGDILEFVSEIKGHYYQNELFVNDKYCYTLEHNVVIQPTYSAQTYNIKQKSIKYDLAGHTCYRWKFHNLAPLEKKYSNHYESMPYIKMGGNSYYNYNAPSSFPRLGANSLQHFIDVAIKNNQEDSGNEKFIKVHEKYIRDISISKSYSDISDPSNHSIEEGNRTYSNQTTFFSLVMEALNMRVIKGSAHNKYSGFPEGKTNYFSMLKYPEGGFKFIFPQTEDRFYFIDEVPIGLEGVTIDVTDKSRIDAAYYDTYQIKMPKTNPKMNQHKQKVLVNIDLNSKNVDMTNRIYLTGEMSTLYRHKYDKLSSNYSDTTLEINLKSKGFEIDTLFKMNQKSSFPFTASYNISSSARNYLSKINDTLTSIDIKPWFNHFIIDIERRKRRENLYIKTKYSDLQDFYIKFNQEVQLLNPTDSTVSVENSFGKYEFQIKQINATNILIHSSYKVYNSYYPKEKYTDILDLKDAYEAAIRENLIIKY